MALIGVFVSNGQLDYQRKISLNKWPFKSHGSTIDSLNLGVNSANRRLAG